MSQAESRWCLGSGVLSAIIMTPQLSYAIGPLNTVRRGSRVPEDASPRVQILLAADSRSPGNIVVMFNFPTSIPLCRSGCIVGRMVAVTAIPHVSLIDHIDFS